MNEVADQFLRAGLAVGKTGDGPGANKWSRDRRASPDDVIKQRGSVPVKRVLRSRSRAHWLRL